MSNMSDILNRSKLFEDRLAGPMNAVREAWDLGPDEFRQKPLWGCYSLQLSPQIVQQEVENEAHVYLILINTPEEVVIAGEPTACERVIQQLGRPVHPIPVTDVVHCEPVKTEYEEIKRVHTDKVVKCPDIDFYSAINYEVSKLDSKTLAHNVATIYGKTVDYSRLIEKVYADGARIFVDLGPRTTCSKWISKTLDKRPHLSISVNRKGTDNREMILQALSSLISHRVPVKLEALFPSQPVQAEKQLMQTIKLGGTPVQQVFEKGVDKLFKGSKALRHQGTEFQSFKVSEFQSVSASGRAYSNLVAPDYAPGNVSVSSFSPFPGEYGSHRNSAHSAFLNVRQHGMRQLAELISSNTNTKGISVSNTFQHTVSQKTTPATQQPVTQTKPCIFDYHDLQELAGGSIANVFGAEYAEIDSYRRCVRLPMEPYLLVSRVTQLDAKLGEFKPSTITTEYDIPENAWYTTDGQIPWAVAVESGQCDLMLISYLGIDFDCKGEQVYRLLDCTLTYLDDMPLEGQTLRYEIFINSFAKHDQNLLFFFNYECFVGNKMVLRMDNG